MASLNVHSKSLVLHYYATRLVSKTRTTRSEPVKQNQSRKRFPCFATATCIYFEFKLIQWSVSILCIWFARVITLVLITSLTSKHSQRNRWQFSLANLGFSILLKIKQFFPFGRHSLLTSSNVQFMCFIAAITHRSGSAWNGQ